VGYASPPSWLANFATIRKGAVFEVHSETRLVTPLATSQSASLSRAIHRLESRGLLRRRNQVAGDQYDEITEIGGKTFYKGLDGSMKERGPLRLRYRFTHILLTTEGRKLADQFIEQEGAIPNG